MIVNLLFVGTGGFFGAIFRYAITRRLNVNVSGFPVGTLIVNLFGSFLLGIIAGLHANEMIILLFGVGFLGAFTTFSTLKFELTNMSLKKYKKRFYMYIILTYGFGILFAYFGYLLSGMI